MALVVRSSVRVRQCVCTCGRALMCSTGTSAPAPGGQLHSGVQRHRVASRPGRGRTAVGLGAPVDANPRLVSGCETPVPDPAPDPGLTSRHPP